jgi:hypothetical protein
MISHERFSEAQPDETASEADPIIRLRRQVEELQAYVRQQWAARTDRALLGLRRLVLLAVLGAVALVGLFAWIITAVVMILLGASGGLATMMGERFWLANLVVGGGAMLLVGVVLAVMYALWAAASKRRTRQKYEHRQREQRRQFGHSAHDRAI